jgi:uncharacterized membrane protein YeaQ/YmgE (transglycosylase-associated protein family)
VKGSLQFEGVNSRRRTDHLKAKNDLIKLRTASVTAFTANLLLSTAVWAQTGDQVVNEGGGALAWILVGLIGGYLASRVVNRSGQGLLRDIFLGIIGGIVGGIIFRAVGHYGVTGFNLWSILVAFIGGVVVLLLYHAVRAN